jgi:hypothetical protein
LPEAEKRNLGFTRGSFIDVVQQGSQVWSGGNLRNDEGHRVRDRFYRILQGDEDSPECVRLVDAWATAAWVLETAGVRQYPGDFSGPAPNPVANAYFFSRPGTNDYPYPGFPGGSAYFASPTAWIQGWIFWTAIRWTDLNVVVIPDTPFDNGPVINELP